MSLKRWRPQRTSGGEDAGPLILPISDHAIEFFYFSLPLSLSSLFSSLILIRSALPAPSLKLHLFSSLLRLPQKNNTTALKIIAPKSSIKIPSRWSQTGNDSTIWQWSHRVRQTQNVWFCLWIAKLCHSIFQDRLLYIAKLCLPTFHWKFQRQIAQYSCCRSSSVGCNALSPLILPP